MLAYDFYGLGQAAPPSASGGPSTQLVQLKVLTPEQQARLATLRAPLKALSDRQTLCLYIGGQRTDRALAGKGASPADYVAALSPLFAKAGIAVPAMADMENFFDGALLFELWDRELLVHRSKTEFTSKGQMWLWTAPPKVFYAAGGVTAGIGALVWFWKFRR
jgi:hypothetical protein